MQEFTELSSIIEEITGVINFDIEEAVTEDEDGNEVDITIVIINHTFDTYNDAIYEELCELYPDNTDEYECEEDFYTTTIIIHK